MVPRRDNRQVSLFRMAFRARPANVRKRATGIEPYKLGAIISALGRAISNQKAVRCYGLDGRPLDDGPVEGSIQVWLEEIKEIKKNGTLHCYALRFSYLNPVAADRGKRIIATKQHEFLEIGDGEVGESGAHLVITPEDSSGRFAGLSRCVMEQMPGLSRSKVVSLIDVLGEAYMAAEDRPIFEYTEGKGSNRRARRDATRLRIGSYPERSENLEDDLEHGVLKRVRFLGEPNETDNVSLDGFEKIEHEFIASVKPAYRTGARAKELISAARERAKALAMRAQLDIEKEEHGELRPKRRELDLDKEGLADQLFSRQETIISTAGFPECYEEMSDDTIDELVRILDHKEFWV